MAMDNSGFDGTVDEAHFAAMWMIGGQDGVESAAAWAVTQGSGRQVSVAAQSGRAFAKGVVSKDTAADLVNLSTPTNGGWFLICRHIDWTANTVTVIALTGPTTTTTPPTATPADYSGVTGLATSPGATYDQPLAWAWVRSSDTTMVLFDLRRVPGSVADLAELATIGGAEGETKVVREGGGSYVRQGGIWVQATTPRFATVALRDSAFAKASGAFKVVGAYAEVHSDSTASNNGIYQIVGSAFVQLLGDTGWINVTYGSGWGTSGGLTVSYRRLNNVVFSRGRGAGTASTPAFTLPAGFRPAQDLRVAAVDAAANTVATMLIAATGVVTPGTANPNFGFSFIAEA